MAMPPSPQDMPTPQGEGAPNPDAAKEGSESPGQGESLTEMIVQTDQALSAIAQVLTKASPDAGAALSKLNEQYRQIIQAVMNQAGGGEGGQSPQQGARAPSGMQSPETQGKPSMQAY